MTSLWNDIASRSRVTLTAEQHQLLERYLDLLFEANQQMNLTRIVDRPTAQVQHVGDALTLLEHLPAGPIELADVGSGGGVPGIVLAIARPDLRVCLIEATRKKAVFLEAAVGQLGLSNVRIANQRAEDAGRAAPFREAFDVAVARAVATLDWLAEWCLPLVRKGGMMLAMKGPKAAEELPAAQPAIKLLGGGPAKVHPVSLPGTTGHVIVLVRKISKTPSSLPRLSTATRGKPLR